MSDNRAGRRLRPLREGESGLSKEKQSLQAEAQWRLRNSGYRQLHLVSCGFHEGVLTLRGQVSSFYLKQLAQMLLRELHGVGEIDNRLEVTALRHGSTEDRSDNRP
jgi:osmotically-inducible protein OsmY